MTLTLSWAENFITKHGFFCKSGRDRYTQTLKTWYKRKDGAKVSIAELRNKCRHLAERCLSDEADFVTDDYLKQCLAGLAQGRTDALLPPSTTQQPDESLFHDDVKVEFIDCPDRLQSNTDPELLTKLRTELLNWYNETIKTRRVQTADIYPQATKIATQIGLASFEVAWDSAQFTNNFLRRNSIRLQEQPHLLTDEQSRIKQLKDRLATFFHTESTKRYLGSKDLCDFAEQLKLELDANVDLTRNWFGSFYKTYGIYLNQQKFVKLKEQAIDDLFNWYLQHSELGFVSSEDILEKGKSLFTQVDLPFTYTSKKSFIEMFCSKKAIRLSRQPFYESGRKNGDHTTLLSIEPKNLNSPALVTDDTEESMTTTESASVIDQCSQDQSFSGAADCAIPASVERELKGDIVKWFKLESKYRFISIYDVIVKSLEWARLLGAVSSNDRIMGVDAFSWVSGILEKNGIDVKHQTHAVSGTSKARKSDEKLDVDITDEQKQGIIDTIAEMLSDSPDLFKNDSVAINDDSKAAPSDDEEEEEVEEEELPDAIMNRSFESAKKELETWFATQSQQRYLSHRDILEHMKKLYPDRKELLTTTWVQNFCRHRPHMSGNELN